MGLGQITETQRSVKEMKTLFPSDLLNVVLHNRPRVIFNYIPI